MRGEYQQGKGVMQAHFGKVVDLLRTEVALCGDVLQAMERERAAMLHAQLEPIGAIAAEKEMLIQRVQAVERQRQEWVGRLAEELGCEADELTLSRLAHAAPPAFAEALYGCRSELCDLLERLRMENRRNAMLSRHAAELLRSFYRVIKGCAANGEIYRPGGRMQAARLNGKFLSHET